MDREKAGIAAVALVTGVGAALLVGLVSAPPTDAGTGPVGEAFGFALPRVLALVGLVTALAGTAVYRARGR